MTLMLRICLIAASVMTTAVMMNKIRRSKVQIEDSIFWVLFSGALLLFSLFPRTAYLLADLAGFQAPSNFIFMLVIFLLLIKVFSMTMRISQLEAKLRELVQRMALDELEMQEEGKTLGELEMQEESKMLDGLEMQEENKAEEPK